MPTSPSEFKVLMEFFARLLVLRNKTLEEQSDVLEIVGGMAGVNVGKGGAVHVVDSRN
jgi:hypothetical protein